MHFSFNNFYLLKGESQWSEMNLETLIKNLRGEAKIAQIVCAREIIIEDIALVTKKICAVMTIIGTENLGVLAIGNGGEDALSISGISFFDTNLIMIFLEATSRIVKGEGAFRLGWIGGALVVRTFATHLIGFLILWKHNFHDPCIRSICP